MQSAEMGNDPWAQIELLIRERRFIGHELARLAGGLSWVIYALRDPANLRARSDDSIRLMGRDIQAFCELTQSLADNVTYSVTEPVVHLETFDPFGALLTKWRDSCRLIAATRNLEFRCRESSSHDPLPHSVHTDPKLLEHLIYNVIINATKYCHRGTVIDLDCREQTIDRLRYHIFTVTDYGIDFEVDTPFQFGVRGGNAIRIAAGGMGTGLFVAQKIANALGGWIETHTRLVSRWNVPLLEPCLYAAHIDSTLPSANLYAELQRLQKTGDFDRIVARPREAAAARDARTLRRAQAFVHDSTYKVEVRVYLPDRGSHHEDPAA